VNPIGIPKPAEVENLPLKPPNDGDEIQRPQLAYSLGPRVREGSQRSFDWVGELQTGVERPPCTSSRMIRIARAAPDNEMIRPLLHNPRGTRTQPSPGFGLLYGSEG
jgi:hypothetical protein